MVDQKKSISLIEDRGEKRLWKVAETTFLLPSYYEPTEVMGAGAYGTVIAAKNLNDERMEPENLVAIKKMQKVFEHRIFAQRTLREIKIMRLLQHDNILGINTII